MSAVTGPTVNFYTKLRPLKALDNMRKNLGDRILGSVRSYQDRCQLQAEGQARVDRKGVHCFDPQVVVALALYAWWSLPKG